MSASFRARMRCAKRPGAIQPTRYPGASDLEIDDTKNDPAGGIECFHRWGAHAVEGELAEDVVLDDRYGALRSDGDDLSPFFPPVASFPEDC